MGLKKAEGQVKLMLEDTILALCRNTLSYRSDINIEGIIGVTLDDEEIFLVNINQSFKNPHNSKREDESHKRTAETDDEVSSDSSCEGSDSGEKKEKKSRKRKRMRKKSRQCSSDVEEQSKYFHNDKENGCAVNNGTDQQNDVQEKKLDVVDQELKLAEVKQEAEDFRHKGSDLVAVKDEVTDFLHLGTQFANLYNSFNSTAYPNIGQHGFALGTISPGASSAVGSPAPLSMSQNIPPMPGPSIRSPAVAKKSTASPRKTLGSPANLTLGSPTNLSNGSPEKATCELCGRVCVSRSKLIIHMRVHTGEKPFICFICGRGCVQKSDLKKHIKTVHKMPVQS